MPTKSLRCSNSYLPCWVDCFQFSVLDPDPFHFGLPDPEMLYETDPNPGSKEISQNHGKFPQKITKITRISSNFFFNRQIFTLNITKQIIFWRNIFFNRKKNLISRIQSCIRIRIRYSTKQIRIQIKMKRIRNTAFDEPTL